MLKHLASSFKMFLHAPCHKIGTFLATKGKIYDITCLDRPSGHQEVEAPRIARESAHEVGTVVSRKHRPTLFPRMICLALISVRGLVDHMARVRTEGLSQ